MIVEVKNATKVYRKFRAHHYAVDDVSLSIERGSTVGLVGESGCGKSTLSRMILGLTNCDKGSIFFEDQEITAMSYNQKRKLRKEMQILFQHPDSTLNPRMRMKDSLMEPVEIHRLCSKTVAFERMCHLLELVGLRDEILSRYPHQLSGGQLQRAALVRVLMLEPKFIILDEPTSMLDVSVQALVMNSLKKVQQQFGLTYLFISHDLNLVKQFSDEIAVMKQGKLIEQGSVANIIEQPQDDYTKSLVHSFLQFSS